MLLNVKKQIKSNINMFVCIKVLIIITFFLSIIILHRDNLNVELVYNSYLYDTDDLLYATDEMDAKKLESTFNEVSKPFESKDIKINSNALKAATTNSTFESEDKQITLNMPNVELENKANSNTNINVLSFNSFVNFTNDKSKQSNYNKYIRDNTKELEEGLIIKSGENSIFVNDIDDVNYVKDSIISSYFDSNEDYDEYKNTGNIDSDSPKKLIDVYIKDNIEIVPGYISGTSIETNKEDLLFDTLNKQSEKTTYKVQNGDTYKSIMSKFNISENDFRLNNPELKLNYIPYVGQEVIVNKIDPIIDIETTYQETKIETIEYKTIKQKDDNIAYGEQKVVTNGKNGSRKVTYLIKEENGKQTSKTVSDNNVLVKPVSKVIKVSSKDTYPTGPTSAGWAWPEAGGSVICGWYCYSGHQAIDISAYQGAPISASKSGTVKWSRWSSSAGWWVEIDHGGGWSSKYVHMRDKPLVSKGQHVSQGQVIGLQGRTGYGSNGISHLHFQILYNGRAMNPNNYL